MILSVGKTSWDVKRYIPIDKVKSFTLVMEDGTEYTIAKEAFAFEMGSVEEYDLRKATTNLVDEQGKEVKVPSGSKKKVNKIKKEKKDEVQDDNE